MGNWSRYRVSENTEGIRGTHLSYSCVEALPYLFFRDSYVFIFMFCTDRIRDYKEKPATFGYGLKFNKFLFTCAVDAIDGDASRTGGVTHAVAHAAHHGDVACS